jgi:hypothetical protein
MGARSGPAAESIDLLRREFAAGKVNKERRDNLARTPSRKLKLQDGAIEHLGARFDVIIARSARATTRTRKLTGALHY